MKKVFCAVVFLISMSSFSVGQCGSCFNGTRSAKNGEHFSQAPYGNFGLTKRFDTTLCGLRYVQASVLTETRSKPHGFNVNGTGFPTWDTIRGLLYDSTSCNHYLKAFMYYLASYTEQVVPRNTVDTVTNPLGRKAVYHPTLIDSGGWDCWGETGTAAYKADVTGIIAGNGVYTINISGFADAAWEIDGVTLLIIYTVPSANYSGNIVLWEGDSAHRVSDTAVFTGFNVCKATDSATAFSLYADDQQNLYNDTNADDYNGTIEIFKNNFVSFNQINTTLNTGQSSTKYITYIGDNGDCYAWYLAGLYWQDTNCIACYALNAVIASSASSCTANTGTATVTVMDTGHFTYQWSNGATTSVVTGLSAGTYSVVVSAPGGCPQESLQVNVLPADSLKVSLSITHKISCYGDSNGAIQATITGGKSPFTFTWSNGATSSSINNLTAGTYSVTVSDSNHCAVPASIKLKQTLLVIGKSFSNVSCYGDSNGSITLTASGGWQPYSYTWSPLVSTSGSASGLKAGTYIIRVTDSAGCVKSDTVTISQPPKITPLISGKDTVCKGVPVTLCAAGGTIYTWNNGATTTCVSFAAANDTTVTLTANDTNGCSAKTSFFVEVVLPPVINITGPKQVCEGQSVTLVASGGGTYLWSNGATTSSMTVSPDSNAKYSVKVSNGCPTFDSAYIIVDIPSINACCTTTINISDSTIIHATGAKRYVWSPSIGLSCDTCALTVASPPVTTTYTVTGTDSNGCSVSTAVTIVVDIPCGLDTIPNVFTPNNDGVNDDFVIKAENLTYYSIVIYDRWGVEVYSSSNPNVYWNGRVLNANNLVPDGVYYYVIKATCNGNNYLKKGFVHVLGENK